MRSFRAGEAAAILGISPHTLRAWERRYGYPRPRRSVGNHRLYLEADIAPLREALRRGLTGASAISIAREADGADSTSLAAALVVFDALRADATMDKALGVHSVEDAVAEIALPTVDSIGQRYGFNSAVWAFASQWAIDWVRRLRRLTPKVWTGTVFVGDRTDGRLDRDAFSVRALELFIARGGYQVVSLPTCACQRILDVVKALGPTLAALLAGHGCSADSSAAWVEAVYRTSPTLPLLLYHADDVDRAIARSATVLPISPVTAATAVMQLAVHRRPPMDQAVKATPRIGGVAVPAGRLER
jgi:DNA-binding transcriptional MerR regulator